jgi:DNA-binding NtrC family response regulator
VAIIRILLVDDDEIVALTLTALLKEYEFEVKTAVNVSEALKFISSETYDVLLSDTHVGNGRWPHRCKRDAPRQSKSHHDVVEFIPEDGCHCPSHSTPDR